MEAVERNQPEACTGREEEGWGQSAGECTQASAKENPEIPKEFLSTRDNRRWWSVCLMQQESLERKRLVKPIGLGNMVIGDLGGEGVVPMEWRRREARIQCRDEPLGSKLPSHLEHLLPWDKYDHCAFRIPGCNPSSGASLEDGRMVNPFFGVPAQAEAKPVCLARDERSFLPPTDPMPCQCLSPYSEGFILL